MARPRKPKQDESVGLQNEFDQNLAGEESEEISVKENGEEKPELTEGPDSTSTEAVNEGMGNPAEEKAVNDEGKDETVNAGKFVPVSVLISNKSPTAYVVTQLGIVLKSGQLKLPIQAQNQEQLNQIKLNANAINGLNDWDGIQAGIVFEEAE